MFNLLDVLMALQVALKINHCSLLEENLKDIKEQWLKKLAFGMSNPNCFLLKNHWPMYKEGRKRNFKKPPS